MADTRLLNSCARKGVWVRIPPRALHHNVRLGDDLYLELATQLEANIVTTGSGMASNSMNAVLVAD
jgi:hypothetical protein